LGTLKVTPIYVVCSTGIGVNASELRGYQDWHVQATPNAIEAYTSPNSSTTFGLYCAGDQCMFYLRDPLLCKPGATSPILMSSIQSAAALSIKCVQINGSLFQILDPFVLVLDTIRQGGVVSFAVPLQNGTFGVTSYSSRGSNEAIKQVLKEAAQSKYKTPPKPSENTPIPGKPNDK
jgi:hypothetical protein